MQINLVSIGNSKGVVLSQALINQCGFKDTIEVALVDDSLILKAPEQPRQGWDKLFRSEAQAEESEDKDMLALKNKWDDEEWEW